ncbi:Methyltransferase domain protein [compost metagenome]
MWHVLEHVPNLEDQIKELKRLLKPNGSIIIAVPNFKSYDANHYKEFWAAYDVPRHLWHFSKTAIHKLFQKENIELVKILPMKFDSFYVSLLSEKYKTGKMNFVKAFFVGLKSNWKAKRNFEYSSHIYVLKSAKN